jgi:hypothetical protein
MPGARFPPVGEAGQRALTEANPKQTINERKT